MSSPILFTRCNGVSEAMGGGGEHDVSAELLKHDVSAELLKHDVSAELLKHDVSAELKHDVIQYDMIRPLGLIVPYLRSKKNKKNRR